MHPRFPGPLLPQWEAVVNTLSFGWSCMEQNMWEHYWHEVDMIRNAMCDNAGFDRPPRCPAPECVDPGCLGECEHRPFKEH